ncbi:MAG: hypothetical protein HY460_02640 [Parcubacteria group bacterium]|nr:hypothetical protein [Parcubacteria group bacterium]
MISELHEFLGGQSLETDMDNDIAGVHGVKEALASLEVRRQNLLAILKKVANGEHHSACALGAVPACTCAVQEAHDILSELGVSH